MGKVECEILGMSTNPSSVGAYALLLKEVFGNRRLPIIIGQSEAQAIALELEGMKPPRPLSHDLMKSIIDNLGGTLLQVYINELRENTYYAQLVIDLSTLTIEIDARPSDAIALAIRAHAPIYVADSVMEAASFIPATEQNPFTNEGEEPISPNPEPIKTKEAKLASLQEKLRAALENEDYERAAVLRDEIKKMSANN
ncbi:MAG: bifunctional nuclease domain-containing protein [Ignavibacteriaceae bacterium]